MPDETKAAEPKTPKTEKVKEISLPAAVLALDATPDGKTLFAACQDGSVFVVDAETGKSELLARLDTYASGGPLLPRDSTHFSAGSDSLRPETGADAPRHLLAGAIHSPKGPSTFKLNLFEHQAPGMNRP